MTLSTSRRVRFSPEYRREHSPALETISTRKLPSISPILYLVNSWFVGEVASIGGTRWIRNLRVEFLLEFTLPGKVIDYYSKNLLRAPSGKYGLTAAEIFQTQMASLYWLSEVHPAYRQLLFREHPAVFTIPFCFHLVASGRGSSERKPNRNKRQWF